MLVLGLPGILPFWSQCCGRIKPCGLISSNHQGPWKRQGLFLTGHVHGHTAKSPEESESMDLGFSFIRVEGGVPRIFWVHSMLVNLNIRAEIKVWERKSSIPQKVSDGGQPGLPKKGTLWVGCPGSLTSCVAGNVFIPNGSLCSGCYSNQNLNVRLSLYNKKS